MDIPPLPMSLQTLPFVTAFLAALNHLFKSLKHHAEDNMEPAAEDSCCDDLEPAGLPTTPVGGGIDY